MKELTVKEFQSSLFESTLGKKQPLDPREGFVWIVISLLNQS